MASSLLCPSCGAASSVQRHARSPLSRSVSCSSSRGSSHASEAGGVASRPSQPPCFLLGRRQLLRAGGGAAAGLLLLGLPDPGPASASLVLFPPDNLLNTYWLMRSSLH